MIAAGLALLTSLPALALSPTERGDVIITEFQADTQTLPDYYGEWFEVYNNSIANLDLAGVTFTRSDGSGFTVGDSVLVASGDFAVFGVECDATRYSCVTVDYEYDFFRTGFDLDFEADSITATASDGTVLDTVVWTDAWGVNQDYAHQVSRNAYTLEWANDLTVNWCPSNTSMGGSRRGTPGALNEWCSTSSPPNADNDSDGFTEQDGDCDDTDPLVNPDSLDGDDGVDQDDGGGGQADDDADCDGTRDDGTTDDDGDGYSEVDGDCDDAAVDVFPDATEGSSADGLDNDCDGCVDDMDGDRDGYGYSAECPESEDCDDEDRDAHPGATEQPYDGIDQDCDGFDECDYDGDGYRGIECTEQAGNDCDDQNPDIHVGAMEIDGDGIDNDCDGDIDVPDRDGDGVTEQDGDCMDIGLEDDAELYEIARGVYPGAVEVCGDLVDNDCDGFYDNKPECSHDASFATVRGGGLCGVASADPRAWMAMVAAGLVFVAARRGRGGEA